MEAYLIATYLRREQLVRSLWFLSTTTMWTIGAFGDDDNRNYFIEWA